MKNLLQTFFSSVLSLIFPELKKYYVPLNTKAKGLVKSATETKPRVLVFRCVQCKKLYDEGNNLMPQHCEPIHYVLTNETELCFNCKQTIAKQIGA